MTNATAREEAEVKLTVIFVDTHRTRMSIIHENEHMPYSRRTVQIALTAEQKAALSPKCVGHEGGEEVFEELGPAWLEPITEQDAERMRKSLVQKIVKSTHPRKETGKC